MSRGVKQIRFGTRGPVAQLVEHRTFSFPRHVCARPKLTSYDVFRIWDRLVVPAHTPENHHSHEVCRQSVGKFLASNLRCNLIGASPQPAAA